MNPLLIELRNLIQEQLQLESLGEETNVFWSRLAIKKEIEKKMEELDSLLTGWGKLE